MIGANSNNAEPVVCCNTWAAPLTPPAPRPHRQGTVGGRHDFLVPGPATPPPRQAPGTSCRPDACPLPLGRLLRTKNALDPPVTRVFRTEGSLWSLGGGGNSLETLPWREARSAKAVRGGSAFPPKKELKGFNLGGKKSFLMLKTLNTETHTFKSLRPNLKPKKDGKINRKQLAPSLHR